MFFSSKYLTFPRVWQNIKMAKIEEDSMHVQWRGRVLDLVKSERMWQCVQCYKYILVHLHLTCVSSHSPSSLPCHLSFYTFNWRVRTKKIFSLNFMSCWAFFAQFLLLLNKLCAFQLFSLYLFCYTQALSKIFALIKKLN